MKMMIKEHFLHLNLASIFYNTDQYSYQKIIINGKTFILCDLWYCDIIFQKKVIKNNIIIFEELYPPISGNYGSNRINELFIEKVIKVLFEKETYNKIESQFNDFVKIG